MRVTLRLYTRAGCCLCEGLEERLRALDPAPVLELVDVDGDPALQARYGLEVPVLALIEAAGGLRPLPRVAPRLQGDQLAAWLTRHGAGTAS
ncbi:MAG: glutaredoxin family protein [Cyanobium sp.]